MEYKRENWEQYKERLIAYGYTEEEISAVKEIRENLDHCPDEQFKELVAQGVIIRTAKLKKPRNYFVNDDGEFLFLNHYHRQFQTAAKFKTEENE